MVAGTDRDAEDSLALDRWDTTAASAAQLDVAVVRFPRIANFGDLDPLRLEPSVSVRWVRSAASLGRPDLVVLPGSKATREDLAWLRGSGLAETIERSGVPVVGICAGLQMLGQNIDDTAGTEGAPGRAAGLGWLDVATTFRSDKVLDRPAGRAVSSPGSGERVSGYRIHHGRVEGQTGAEPWLVTDDGTVLGWRRGRVLGTTLHGVFDDDGMRGAILRWAASQAGIKVPSLLGVDFESARQARLDLTRSDERRVGTDGCRTCRSGWSRSH